MGLIQRYLHKITLFFAGFLLTFSVSAQQDIISSAGSTKGYIYKITNEQAHVLYEKGILQVNNGFFHTLIDSFFVNDTPNKDFGNGYYLKTWFVENNQVVELLGFFDFEVFILNNYKDLNIRVVDTNGKSVKNATVKVKNTKLHFDEASELYVLPKSNRKGVVSVELNGSVAFYELNRKINNSRAKRILAGGLNNAPLKYIWRPAHYIVSLPVDGVRSIKRRYATGSIYSTKNFFEKNYNKIACLFGSWNCEDRYFDEKHPDVVYFNQPIYRPGDTVKYKIYLTNKKGKGLNKKLYLNIGYKNPLRLPVLSPYRRGAYEGEFHLHDSLNLKLDSRYYLTYANKRLMEYGSGSFYYEDYVLKANKLDVRVTDKKHYRDSVNKIYYSAKDANGLPVLDGRIEVLVKPKKILKTFDKNFFLPDTLSFIQKAINQSGETTIEISDTIFPAANIEYEVTANMLNADNELLTKTSSFVFLYKELGYDISLSNDSVLFKIIEDGKNLLVNARIYKEDGFGNKTEIYDGAFPCMLKADPLVAKYTIQYKDEKYTQNVAEFSSGPGLQFYNHKDSVYLALNNNQKLPVNYFVYKGNKEILNGTDSLLNISLPVSKNGYQVLLKYIWGGEVREMLYNLPGFTNQLSIEAKLPEKVYPGQKVLVEVTVKDEQGKPVKNVDVTSFAYTRKFDKQPDEMLNFSEKTSSMVPVNTFSIHNLKKKDIYLQYDTWKQKAGLHTQEYYKFAYTDSIYNKAYATKENNTKFSLFIADDGKLIIPSVIYVDNIPVWISTASNEIYSFSIFSGYHNLRVRLKDREIFADSIYFAPGLKTLISINKNIQTGKTRFTKAEEQFSKSEKYNLSRYLFTTRNQYTEGGAYVNNFGKVYLMPEGYSYNALIGPVAGMVDFNYIENYSLSFKHEPGFEYEFSKGLMKMREKKIHELLYRKDINKRALDILKDEAYTEQYLLDNYKRLQELKRIKRNVISYPGKSTKGFGTMLISTIPSEKSVAQPLNILLYKMDSVDLINIYSGSTKEMHMLPEGYYKLIYYFSDSYYHAVDSLYIEKNGISHFSIQLPGQLKKDKHSESFSNDIINKLYGGEKVLSDEIKKNILQQHEYSGSGEEISGLIQDEEGQLLYGVIVMAKGTHFGTVTNEQGEFSIRIPPAVKELTISYIGYETTTIDVPSEPIVIKLKPSETSLDEVVVTGYGNVKRSLTASSVLMGKVPGLSIRPGASPELFIRGTNSLKAESKPLIVINGIVYDGNFEDIDKKYLQNITILKDESAVLLYGARAANGVILINTIADEGIIADSLFATEYTEEGSINSIRENFSDYAFWQPYLKTDAEGKAVFEVVYPDDITGWDVFFYAFTGKKKTGSGEFFIQSYKPLSASIVTPGFMVEGDSAGIIGKIQNYGIDSIAVSSYYTINEQQTDFANRNVKNILLDTIQVNASKDTINISYVLQREDGYFDGEKRKIPVIPIGLEKTTGEFFIIEKDTQFVVNKLHNNLPLELAIQDNALDALFLEVKNLIEYPYDCNEQLASKLKGLLLYKEIAAYKGENFNKENRIKKIIRDLEKNQNSTGFWGWWKNQMDSYWITLHVTEALIAAQTAGYKVSINKTNLLEEINWKLLTEENIDNNLKALHVLKLLDTTSVLNGFIQKIEEKPGLTTSQKLKLDELKLKLNISTDIEKYTNKLIKTIFGGYFLKSEGSSFSLFENDHINTIGLYKVLKLKDSVKYKEYLNGIKTYFLQQKQYNGYWRNTYESSLIAETILADVLKNKTGTGEETIELIYPEREVITKFPVNVKPNGDSVIVKKSGGGPLYFSWQQRYWETNPVINDTYFKINTSFKEKAVQHELKAGEVITLLTEIEVMEDLEYVMIKVPIPASCNYVSKPQQYGRHIEYFKEEMVIFIERLKRGKHNFEVELIPRFSGSYTINPASMELMYAPVVQANNAIKQVIVQ